MWLAEAHGYSVATGIIRLEQLRKLVSGELWGRWDWVWLTYVDEDLLLAWLWQGFHTHSWHKDKQTEKNTDTKNSQQIISINKLSSKFAYLMELFTRLWSDYFGVWVFSLHLSHCLNRHTAGYLSSVTDGRPMGSLFNCIKRTTVIEEKSWVSWSWYTAQGIERAEKETGRRTNTNKMKRFVQRWGRINNKKRQQRLCTFVLAWCALLSSLDISNKLYLQIKRVIYICVYINGRGKEIQFSHSLTCASVPTQPLTGYVDLLTKKTKMFPNTKKIVVIFEPSWMKQICDVWHFEKYVYSLSCREVDGRIETTLFSLP